MAASEISARINVDVSEALTGLKAVQREAKKATQALRELEAAQSTKSLHEALIQREGVEEYIVDAHGGFAKIHIDNGQTGGNYTVEGPARIVVNRD